MAPALQRDSNTRLLSRRSSTVSQNSHRLAKPGLPSVWSLRRAADDGFDGVAADVFNCGEAEADAVTGGSEIGVGDLYVRRQDGDVDFAALADVLDDVFGLAGFTGEQRGHELDRVVGFEPGGVVGEQGVGGGVGLVEAVAGELEP